DRAAGWSEPDRLPWRACGERHFAGGDRSAAGTDAFSAWHRDGAADEEGEGFWEAVSCPVGPTPLARVRSSPGALPPLRRQDGAAPRDGGRADDEAGARRAEARRRAPVNGPRGQRGLRAPDQRRRGHGAGWRSAPWGETSRPEDSEFAALARASRRTAGPTRS